MREDDPMAEPEGQPYGFHERLAGRFGVGGDALYAFVACVIALAVSGLAACKRPTMQEEAP